MHTIHDIKLVCSQNGWKYGQKSQGDQSKSPFPMTTHDTCHFCVGL